MFQLRVSAIDPYQWDERRRRFRKMVFGDFPLMSGRGSPKTALPVSYPMSVRPLPGPAVDRQTELLRRRV